MSETGFDLLAESEDQAALRQLARDVAEREVAPRAHEADEAGAVSPEMRGHLLPADVQRAAPGH
jgi:hypothetical protein